MRRALIVILAIPLLFPLTDTARAGLLGANWAFKAPTRPAVPETRSDPWVRNEIDAFVLAQLRLHKLQPNPEADRATLIRRLSFDLTGLPPTPEEIDAFLADRSDNAYERVVDRLLMSPRYGERMALDWLDAARFADTHGYQRDGGRDMTLWRDWVIRAFNQNMPFDQFTVEQLAGDLLPVPSGAEGPGATDEQRIASGFNRNHRINVETGAVPEEFHAAYVIDRVNTTGTVWLGLTVACAQCHNHKYDPISQAEYYKLYAFFNNLSENGIDGAKGNAAPLIRLPTAEQTKQLEALDAKIKETKQDEQLAALQQQRAALDAKVATAMVMQEMPKPRETVILLRGEYDQHGPKVTADVPAFLPPLPERAPRNRLGLARWLVSSSNPLTSRVIVNRLWQGIFGTGLVKTSDDFGIQGERPSHPELLDWLAVEFREPSTSSGQASVLSERSESKGWDVKRLVKRIVMSATYRQSSTISPASLAIDPEDRLLSHFPRKRLQAEFIRDQALAVAGLLDNRIGGASVSPYQPAGLWEEMTSRTDSAQFTAQDYHQSHGPDLYRRTMYTFWKRTIPPPSLYAFDAPDREVCVVRRATTNTPLQALVLWNDPTYVEASRKLAERVMRKSPDATERITFAFRLATGRSPSPQEAAILRKILVEQSKVYVSDPSAAAKLLTVGESPRDAALSTPDLAAWTIVSSVVLNLDETITKN